MQQMIEELKTMISTHIDLGGADLSKFGENDAIFGEEGLGLDSLDAVELIMLLKKHYGITVDNMQKGREIFKNLGTLAKYVTENRTK